MCMFRRQKYTVCNKKREKKEGGRVDAKLISLLSALGCYLMMCQRLPNALSNPHSLSVYNQDSSCNFHDRLSYGCAELTDGRVHSSIECGGLCSKRVFCEGYSLTATGKCYLHTYCTGHSHLYTNCSSLDVDIRYFLRKPASADDCLNGGFWKEKACRCRYGFLGQRCERYAESCEDLDLSDNYVRAYRKLFYVKPVNFSSPIRVYCSFMPGDPRTFLLRYRMSPNSGFTFNHTWDEYVNGFYYNSSKSTRDGWIGLETIHYLTTVEKRQTLVLALYDIYREMVVNYTFFGTVIGDASTNYQLHFDDFITGYTTSVNGSDLMPCLSSDSPIPFSTPDVDNDLDPEVHCAKEAGAGWWFSECSPRPSCNPLGTRYQSQAENVTADKIHFEGLDLRNSSELLGHLRLYLIY